MSHDDGAQDMRMVLRMLKVGNARPAFFVAASLAIATLVAATPADAQRWGRVGWGGGYGWRGYGYGAAALAGAAIGYGLASPYYGYGYGYGSPYGYGYTGLYSYYPSYGYY